MGERDVGPSSWPAGVSGASERSQERSRERSPLALIDAIFPPSKHATTRMLGERRARPPHDAAPAPEPTTTATGDELPPDGLQSTIQRSLHHLCSEIGLDLALVLHRDQAEGDVRALASYSTQGLPPIPNDEESACLWRIGRAADLGQPGQPDLVQAFSVRSGYSVALAIEAEGGIASMTGEGMLLLVGGEQDRPGRVRPRTLAHLESLASRLRTPLASARTASRIAELDSAVMRLDRLALLGSLVAEVIHEVRNPLVSIKTFLELLPGRLDDPDFHGDFRQLVVDEVFRLERLLDEVLAHARPGPTDQHTEDANVRAGIEAMEQLLTHRAREAGVELVADTSNADEQTRASITPDALRQVLLNLCVNAIAASPDRGQVRVSTRRRASSRGPDNIEIWIEDDGPGVPEEDRELIFEPFRSNRSDSPGGLGLAISRRLAEQAGGRLFVAQGTDGGARFILRLPAEN